MKNTGIVIASLVGGMIIGSALTMLFTPQSGAELRKQIKGKKLKSDCDDIASDIASIDEDLAKLKHMGFT